MLSAKAATRKDLSAKPATMTHQHFRQIAATLRKVRADLPPLDTVANSFDPDAAYADIVWQFADDLSRTNPNFNRERFVAACRPQEG